MTEQSPNARPPNCKAPIARENWNSIFGRNVNWAQAYFGTIRNDAQEALRLLGDLKQLRSLSWKCFVSKNYGLKFLR